MKIWPTVKVYLYSVAKGARRGFIASIVRLILSLLSFVYFLIVEIRDILYRIGIARAYSLPRPVVSVGNITVGGTGKTPLVEALAKKISSRGKKSCILMRGYGADEDKIFKEVIPSVPVCVGKDRVEAARQFLAGNSADIFILDDGFQYRRLKRDLDIVALDATGPFGNGRLLPRGILREPLSALRRADILVLTKADLADDEELDELRKRACLINKDALIVEAKHKPLHFYNIVTAGMLQLEWVRAKKVASCCGIGNPSSFEDTLERLGASVVRSHRFEDHHKYTSEDLENIFDDCENFYVDTIVMTQKDLVNMQNILDGSRFTVHGSRINILVLKMELEVVKNEEGLSDRLYSLFSG